MPANVDGMVREGINAYRAGKKEEARAFLLKAVEIDERNEQAWLWLSAVVESVDEQQICLENVLAINPGNERAKQGIQLLKQKAAPAPPAPPAEDVVASVSFTAPPPSPPKSPSQTSPFNSDIEDEIPTNLEWDAPPTASSSASSTRKVNEPSPAEYDDWVSGLNLGSKSGSSLLDEINDEPPPAPPRANLDDMTKFIASSAFDEDDDEDLFGSDARMPEDIFSGPFSAPETAVPPATIRRDSQPKPPASPPPARPAAAPRVEPSDNFLDEDDLIAHEDDTFIAEDFGDYDQMTLEAPDPAEMFRHIPKEIKATRLPGTNERYPLLVILGFLVAIAANVGAVYFLIMRLTGQ